MDMNSDVVLIAQLGYRSVFERDILHCSEDERRVLLNGQRTLAMLVVKHTLSASGFMLSVGERNHASEKESSNSATCSPANFNGFPTPDALLVETAGFGRSTP